MATLIQIRRGTAAEWSSANPILANGEIGFVSDENKIKIGDGTTSFNSLDYLEAEAFIDSVALGTDTTGNYVETLISGDGISISGEGTESASATITNTGVLSLTGTTNEITVSASAGNITLSLPTSITVDVIGNVTGNADTASTLAVARTISLGGSLSGSASFDGGSDITINASINSDSIDLGTDTTGNYVADVSGSGEGISVTGTGEGASVNIQNTGVTSLYGTASEIEVSASSGSVTLSLPSTINADTTGNASTASTLQTARSVSLVGDVSGSASFNGGSDIAISATVADDSHNHIISNVDGLQDELNLKAPLDSPALTGTPTAPTASASANSTQIATTAFVQTNISNLIDGAPGALDTLNELAAALGDDANFASTVTNSLAGKQPIDADLTAIAGLSASATGFLKKDGDNSWSLDGNTYLTGNQTITLSGDVSGSGTTEITVTVADDSHNHIISNVDGLQTALDAKLDSASYTASDALTKIKTVDGAGSGLDADLLDGQDGSHYLDWNNTTNKPDPTITLLGDVSGSATFTDLTSASVNVTIQPNSVELGTDTTGNYVATASAGSGIEISGSGSENADLTIINTGVTSLTGTANEVELSASAGAVQVGLPNEVRIESLSSGTASVDIGVESPTFVAVGAFSTTAALSTNGITWTRRTLPSSQEWSSVTYGNSLFFAVTGLFSSSSAAASSTDGITWTARTLPSSQRWSSVTYGNNAFVAIATSNSAAAATSTDGITWTARTLPSSQSWSSVIYGNNTFVTVGYNSAAAATSTDGITWTARTMPSSQFWRSVTYGNNTFVAVGNNSSAAATSTDGITWTARTMPSSQEWKSVTYGNNIFVAVGNNSAAAATSTDGITWTARTMPASSGWLSVAHGNNTFIALTNSSILATSTDGITWTSRTQSVIGFYNSATFGTPTVLTLTPIASNLVPTQTGNSGKYLTTDGTTSSWGTIDLSGYQPLDGDLTSIAGLSGSAGLLRKTDLNTFTLDTATYLTGNETITLSGDATGSGTTSISLTLANSGVSAATYGSASAVPTIAIDAKGRITSASAIDIAIEQSAVTNLTTDLAAKAPLASPALTGTPTAPTASAGTNTTQIATTEFVNTATAAVQPTIHPMFIIGGV